MKFILKSTVLLLILSFPSISLGKTFTACGGDFNFFLKKAEEYAIELGVSSEVLRKTVEQAKCRSVHWLVGHKTASQGVNIDPTCVILRK